MSNRPSISVRDVPMIPTGPNSASLQFDTKVLANLPKVAVICPTGNRGHLWPLMKHNMLKQSYPHELIHWIIVDDGQPDPTLDANVAEFAKTWPGSVELKRLSLPERLILGRKRNLMCELGFKVATICVHMDDDDLYHKESLKVRVALLEMYKKEGILCVGCTQVNCYDVVTDTAFNAFDPCCQNKPSGFSESTVAYYKEFWEERKWPDEARNAEGHEFMLNRWNKAMNIPSNFVICQLTHDNNTIVRRTYASAPDGEKRPSYRETNMDAEERAAVDTVHESLLMRNPNERAAKVFLDIAKNIESDPQRLLEIYYRSQWGIEAAHRFKVFRRAKMSLDHFSHIESRNTDAKYSGIRIAYVCSPSSNPFPWNAFERCPNWGGSEEAVKHITNYFVNQLGAKVVVFSAWSKELIESSGPISELKRYGRMDPETGVWWKPYEMWNAMDESDLTVVWRDPGQLDGFRDPAHKSGKTCLDVHDQLQIFVPSALNPVDFIMVKSDHHKNTCIPAEHHHKCIVIPNGFDPEILTKSTLPPRVEEIDDASDEFVVTTPRKSTSVLPVILSSEERKYLFINTSRPDRGLSCLMDTVKNYHQSILKTNKKYKFKKSAWAYGFQDMPSDLVIKWKTKQSGIPALDLLEKISEKAVSHLYNNGKFFLYFSRFIETDCISLTKAMFYGSFPLVTRVGAVGEKIQKYIDWLKTKNYTDVRVPVLYDIPADRLIPTGYGPENERHPNDSSTGLYDEQGRMKAWLDVELAKDVTPRDQEAMREFIMEHYTWNSIVNTWNTKVFTEVEKLREDRRMISRCNDVLEQLQKINPEVTKIVQNRRIVLVNPRWESEEDERIAKVIIKNHQKVAHVIHTNSVKSLEAFVYSKFLTTCVEGFDVPETRTRVIIAQGCGLNELIRRIRETRDINVIDM